MSNDRGWLAAGIVGLTVGVFLGNSIKRGALAKQMRSAGRIFFKKARQTAEHGLSNWID